MKFKSKTELAIHLKELVDSGYLIEEWDINKTLDDFTTVKKIYTPNYKEGDFAWIIRR